jgi:N-acetylglutamate synthase/N-acetylornithine aminotransferase
VIIRLQGHDVFRCGQAIEVTAQALLEALRSDTTVQIEVTIGAGGFLGRAWGCDLSPAYISLNAGKET